MNFKYLLLLITTLILACTPKDYDKTNNTYEIENSINYKTFFLDFEFGDKLIFETLNTDNGLSNSNVLDVIQDSNGYIWIATGDGLDRYDGVDFKTFRFESNNPTSIGSNFIFSLLIDKNDNLWVATDPGGLNKYNPKTETFTRYQNKKDNSNSLISNSVWSLTQDNIGNIWVGTMAGLDKFNPETEEFTHYLYDKNKTNSINGPTVYSGLLDSDGDLWFTTRNGLNLYSPEKDHFITYSHDPNNPDSLSSNFVWDIFEDSNKNLWVGTRHGGLNLFNKEDGTFKHYLQDKNNINSINDNSVYQIFEDSQKRLWVATENGGLNHFDVTNNRFHAYKSITHQQNSLVSNSLQGIYEDNTGTIWIYSSRKGISKLYQAFQRFSTISAIPGIANGLNSNNVHAIYSEDNTLWVGTTEGGLNKIDLNNSKKNKYYMDDNNQGFTSNNIYGLYSTKHSNYLWIATVGGGLVKLNKNSDEIINFRHDKNDDQTISSNYLTVISPASNNNLWIGTLGLGLDLFNTQNNTINKFKHDPEDMKSLSDNTIFALETDEYNNLWIGTSRGGLNYLPNGSTEFTRYMYNPDNKNSIIDNTINALSYDKKGYIWCGTSNGLSKLDIKSGQFTSYTFTDKLKNNTIYGIEISNRGYIWLSTGYGLALFNPITEKITSIVKEEGLQGNTFNLFAYHKDNTGKLYFGGPNGLNIINPDKIERNYNDTKTVITDIELFNKKIPIGSPILPYAVNFMKSLTFNHNQNILTLEYKGLNYQLNTKTQYKHRLLGFENEWTPASDISNVTYTNLDPGSYLFQAISTNNDGVWGSEIKEIEIKILPPWWEMNLFRIFVVIFIISTLILYLYLRERSSILHKKILEDKVNVRTQKLQIANKQLQELLNESQLLKNKIQEMAIRDPLTQLYNRRFLTEYIDKVFASSERNNTQVNILILDIDNFKKINDIYSHMAGDLVLKTLSSVLVNVTRKEDLVCRFGGEEFVIVLPGITDDDLKNKCDEIQSEINRQNIIFNEQNIKITVSMGISIYPKHSKSYDKLISLADSMLYKAKNSGKNKYYIYKL